MYRDRWKELRQKRKKAQLKNIYARVLWIVVQIAVSSNWVFVVDVSFMRNLTWLYIWSCYECCIENS